MRTLPTPKPLPKALRKRLAEETTAIVGSGDPKAVAERRYGNARKTQWFAPVIKELGRLAGAGERCMFCSGSEASDVEHYKPKAVFPELAMTWENFLWSCTPCQHRLLSAGIRLEGAADPGVDQRSDRQVPGLI